MAAIKIKNKDLAQSLYPLTFHPIFKERVWGGRKIEQLYRKRLPKGKPIGESWEISDRPGDVSVIVNGPLAGRDLHWLVEKRGAELLGMTKPLNGRFPLLIKILDAREKLSLQVHPPADKAEELGGEPKTEMWYITDASPKAELFVGLKRGVTREAFEKKVADGSVADCFHRTKVRAGDAMFLPSGRVHAIGGGLVIFEIQQNSDTTYRVFDWNRVGLDGKPRELHVRESLASIDFDDFEPGLVAAKFKKTASSQTRMLISDPLFTVEECRLRAKGRGRLARWTMQILAVLHGEVEISSEEAIVRLKPGQFCLIPASLDETHVRAGTAASYLRVEA